VCVRRKSDYVERLIDELAALGARTVVLFGDLKDPATPSRLVEKAAADLGGIDSVISNAGGVDPGPLMELSVERFNNLMNLNCLATLLLAQASYRHLQATRGTLVAVSSAAGAMPARGTAAYGPSKAALTMLCRQLAHEWNDDGIRVNVVSPGLIRTPLNETVFQNGEIMRKRMELIPVHRIGEPFDVARAVWYFASPDNHYSTGLDLLVDGGLGSSILGHIPGAPRPKN
jgi:NAD(P)-dependent dehydrogenase (short-subunit alcohol dehydrogenase family)